MNFKTPFKVLTTAALIGTLSLSAVAPGAASAAEKTTVQSKSVKALAEYSVAQYILTKEGAAPITLTAAEYEDLYVDAAVSGKSFEELLNGYAVASVITENDKVFTLEDYESAYVDAIVGEGDTTPEALLESLDKAGKSTDKPADLAKGEIGEDGKLVAGEPVEEDFEVTEIAAITTTTVDVKFPAVKADLTNKTIEVKDSKGQVRAVKAIDISEGDKEASFTFETPVAEADLVGTWTVDGAEYNFDAINQVEAINAAATTTPLNEIKLLNALNDAKIENVNEDKLADYATAIADAAPTTLADVQKVIDEENEVITDAEKEAAAVKAVAEATNQVQLLKALEANFERVNADWIAAYAGGKVNSDTSTNVAGFIIADADKETPNKVVEVTVNGLDLDDWTVATTTTTLDADNIQGTIDAINGYQVSEAYDKAFKSLKAADVTAARTVANTYIADAEENADDFKGFAIDSLDILDAVIKVDAATTNNTLKKALTDLALLDETLAEKYNKTAAFDIETVVESNLPAYRTAIDKAEIGKKNQIKDIQTIITAVNGEAGVKLLAAVATANENYVAKDTAKEKALLDALKAVVASDSVTFKDVKVVDANVADYKTELEKVKNDGFTVAEIKTAIVAANKAATAVADAKAFAETHKRVLGLNTTANDPKLITADDVTDAIEMLAAYTKLSAEAKAKYTAKTATELETLTNTAKGRYVVDITLIGKPANMVKKLDVLNHNYFSKLSDTAKEEVATLFILNGDTDKSGKLNEILTGVADANNNYTKFNSVGTDLTQAVADYKELLNEVNTLEKKTEVQDFLTSLVADPATGVSKYLGFASETEAKLVAGLLFDAKPEAGYQTVAEMLEVIK